MIDLIVTFCFWLPSFGLAQQVPTASRQYCKRFLHHFWEDFILSTNLQQERVWINVNYKSSIWCNQEIRNSNCGRLMAALVQSHTFSVCNHSHLSVGHTHEDVDAVLSVVKRALDSEPVLLTPRDFMRAINKKLEPLFEQQGMTFKTFWVEQEPLAVKLWKRITFCSIHRPKKQNSMLSLPVVFKVSSIPNMCALFAVWLSKFLFCWKNHLQPFPTTRYVIGWAYFRNQSHCGMLTGIASPRGMRRWWKFHNHLHLWPAKARQKLKKLLLRKHWLRLALSLWLGMFNLFKTLCWSLKVSHLMKIWKQMSVYLLVWGVGAMET